MTDWTPGPWEARDRGFIYSQVGNDPNWCLGKVYHALGPNSPAESAVEANARLIAAAPDLYAALEKVRQACLFDDDDGQIGVSEDVAIPSWVFDEICAALNKAKARGETE